MSDLVLLDGELGGVRTDIVVRDGKIAAIERKQRAIARGEALDCNGGAVIPALHDHHVHLLALAAAKHSVVVGPPAVRTPEELADVLRCAAATRRTDEWVRATGYHESVGGELDRWRLDALVADHPVRVQHRSGALWTLNSRALQEIDVAAEAVEGVERDAAGEVTGRLFRVDDWLRRRLPPPPPPDLADVARLLASYGVAGTTDATPYTDVADIQALADAVRGTKRSLRVTATGGAELAGVRLPAPLLTGPVKVILDDARFPSFATLTEVIRAAHEHRRPIAFHCVTEMSAAVVCAALGEAGTIPGDRIEHGSVIDRKLMPVLASLGVTVVTQPGFVRERGDEYLEEFEGDAADLYRCGTLIESGIPVGGSTDAPFADPDPWRAMSVAVSRLTLGGAALGPREAIRPARAVALFTSRAGDPGGESRRVAVGAPADLCVLRVPLAAALADLRSEHVAMTMVGGRVSYDSREAG
ncbi:MAG TPA: amidohydrolase family protein [Acidimicrobiia bacterium]